MKWVLVCSAILFVCGIYGRERPYINFKIVEIKGRSPETMKEILWNMRNIGLDVLSRTHANRLVAMVKPNTMKHVLQVVSKAKAMVRILQDNLQESVDEEFRHLDSRHRQRQTVSLEEAIEEFLTLDGIYEFQERVVTSCTNLANVKMKTIGYSTNNQPINVIQISKDGSTTTKKTIFIEAGIHAREWLSPATANYIIYQLACNNDNTDMLDLFNWEVISVLNPDGYQYTHKGHRYWRNNRQKNNGSDCIGTDVNRNFEIGFGRSDGSSDDMCDENYRGLYPYSTPEAEALRDYVLSINNSINSYLALHTFGQYILLPWSYKEGIPLDYHNLMTLARTAQKAMDVPFEIGSAFSLIYPAAGTSHDFVREKAGIALTYAWEMMPDSGHKYDGFSPGERLLPVYTQTIWRGVRAYVQAVADQMGAVIFNC